MRVGVRVVCGVAFARVCVCVFARVCVCACVCVCVFCVWVHSLQPFSLSVALTQVFCIEQVVCTQVTITEFDRVNFRIKATCKGEKFSKAKHTHGTEVKAITYSAMQIHETPTRSDVYTIVGTCFIGWIPVCALGDAVFLNVRIFLPRSQLFFPSSLFRYLK